MLKEIRVHHLLCVPRFIGEGYSDGFGKNLSQIHRWLYEHPEERLKVVCHPDGICEACPHLQGDICSEDGNHVEIKDRELAEQLEIREGEFCTWKELLRIAEEKLTAEIFAGSCSRCRWYQKGICSFEKYRKN